MFDRLKRLLGLLLTVCCLSACFAAPPKASASGNGERVNRALLIGVDDFVSRQSTYPSSTNNVFAIQEALQASAVPFEMIMIPALPVTNADEMTKLIRSTFANSDCDDVNYLYISTHGEYNPDGGEDPTLLLSDGKTEGRITPQQLQDAFNGIAGTKVILLDACYSGAFIGKGMRKQPQRLCFLGDDFKVLTSSGAMEESWYWNTADSTESTLAERGPQGAFYFTQALSQSISPRYGFPADANKDGRVTLNELYNALLENHAASTPQVYPQDDDFEVFAYNPADNLLDSSERSPIGDVTFSSSSLSQADRELTLEYTALRPVRVAYQIVYQRDGKWRFDEARLLYDNVEKYTAFGDEQGGVSPGRKVRSLSLNLQSGESYGYVLVQLVSIEDGKLTVHAGRVIAIPPATGDLALGVEVADQYAVRDPRELAIFVRHAFPCLLSVTVVNDKGETVRRLCHRQSTRPMKITPEGSTFYWNGLAKSGDRVPAGLYHIRIDGVMNEQTFSVESNPIRLT